MTSNANALRTRLRAATASFVLLAIPVLIAAGATAGLSGPPASGATAPVEAPATTR